MKSCCNGKCNDCGSCMCEEVSMTRNNFGNYYCLVCLPPVYAQSEYDNDTPGVIVKEQVVS